MEKLLYDDEKFLDGKGGQVGSWKIHLHGLAQSTELCFVHIFPCQMM